jgi:integrase
MATVARGERPDGHGGVGVTYRVRWRDPAGRQRSRSFTRKAQAERFRSLAAADLVRGEYIDPDAGKVTFADYAKEWLAAQTFDEATAQAVEHRLRLHALPVLGGRELRQVKPSTVQSWIRGLDALAPAYQQVIFANVSTVFAAAVDDELLAKNPCRAASVRRPRVVARKVVPWEHETVLAVRDALPDRYGLLVTLAAGLGLRQGEVFGLSPVEVDFLRGRVEVRRQVKLYGGNRQAFALPKGRKTRTVPLPESVKDDLAAYLTRFPARSVQLPWGTIGGEQHEVPLVLSTRETSALNRNYFNTYVWKKALRAVGVADTRENGCHALRHF